MRHGFVQSRLPSYDSSLRGLHCKHTRLQDGLIAINYAARALGVTRHMRVLQAMQFCPELKCLHVQTLGEFLISMLPPLKEQLEMHLFAHLLEITDWKSLSEHGHASFTAGGETGQEGLDGPINSGLTHPNDRLLQKACLER